jgi:hypothetical protein
MAGKSVVFTVEVYAGNRRAGAKGWAKQVTSIDPSRPNGYGLIGEFLNCSACKGDTLRFQGCLPEGSLLVLGGRGGSWKNSTAAYVLTRIKEGGELNLTSGYQSFQGQGMELVARSRKVQEPQEVQEIVNRYPELAPAVGSLLFPLFAAVKAQG